MKANPNSSPVNIDHPWHFMTSFHVPQSLIRAFKQLQSKSYNAELDTLTKALQLILLSSNATPITELPQTMGNTISASTNIVFFADPLLFSHTRYQNLNRQSTSPFLHIPETLTTSDPRYCTRPEPTTLTRWNPDYDPKLTCYEVINDNSDSGIVLEILWSLCNELRVHNGKRRNGRTDLWHVDWKPKALLHLQANFGNPASNAVLSILLSKTSTYTAQDGGVVTTGQHSFIHIYEPIFLAESFEGALKELVELGSLMKVEVQVDAENLSILEAHALFWAKMRWEGRAAEWDSNLADGVNEEGVEDEKDMIVKRLEEGLWNVWYADKRADSVFGFDELDE